LGKQKEAENSSEMSVNVTISTVTINRELLENHRSHSRFVLDGDKQMEWHK
jgi:hypothetical protein